MLTIPPNRLRDSPITPNRQPFSHQPLLEKTFREVCASCSGCCYGIIPVSKTDPNLPRYQLALGGLLRLGLEYGNFDAGLGCPLRQKRLCTIHDFKPWRCKTFPISEYHTPGGTSLYLRSEECPIPAFLYERGLTFLYLEEVADLPIIGTALSTVLDERGSVFMNDWAFHNTQSGPILPISFPCKR